MLRQPRCRVNFLCGPHLCFLSDRFGRRLAREEQWRETHPHELGANLLEVDRVHRHDHVRAVAGEKAWRYDPLPGAGDIRAVAVGVDVDRELDAFADAKRGQESNALGAAAPDHDPPAIRQLLVQPAAPRGPVGADSVGKRLDLPRHFLCRLLGWQGRTRPGARPGADQRVLIIEIAPKVDDVEASCAEGPGERTEAEIRAVLIINVPERAQLQDAGHFRHHGKGDRFRPIADRAAQYAKKTARVGDVLHDHLRADEIRLVMAVRLRVPVFDEGYSGRRRRVVPQHRVKARGLARAMCADQTQKLALAAADLEDLLALKVVALDQLLGKEVVKPVEGWGDRLRGFVVFLVAHEIGIEGAVPDEAAAAAEPQTDVALRAGERGRVRAHQPYLMGGYALDFVEYTAAVAAAGRADRPADRDGRRELPHLGHFVHDIRPPVGRGARRGEFRVPGGSAAGVGGRSSTCGSGIGTMNTPPRRRYSACCAKISSTKFQVRSSTASG